MTLAFTSSKKKRKPKRAAKNGLMSTAQFDQALKAGQHILFDIEGDKIAPYSDVRVAQNLGVSLSQLELMKKAWL